jgi:hypothetical protein
MQAEPFGNLTTSVSAPMLTRVASERLHTFQLRLRACGTFERDW